MSEIRQQATTGRAPRADARQNRARILAAAHSRFAADGLAAEMDQIAREAGVAVGTLYHHFGTKEALLEAVVAEGIQDFDDYVHGLLAEPDPWAGVEGLFRHLADHLVHDRAFSELIGAQPALRASTTAIKQAMGPLVQQILTRAQAAGQLRADVVVADVPLLLAGLSAGQGTPASRERYLDIVLSGLRTDKN
jgi:AcrR family transcriptional regulator